MLFVTRIVNWPLFQPTDGTVGNARGLTVIVKFCVALRLGEAVVRHFQRDRVGGVGVGHLRAAN